MYLNQKVSETRVVNCHRWLSESEMYSVSSSCWDRSVSGSCWNQRCTLSQVVVGNIDRDCSKLLQGAEM